jgi:hypothetical protein
MPTFFQTPSENIFKRSNNADRAIPLEMTCVIPSENLIYRGDTRFYNASHTMLKLIQYTIFFLTGFLNKEIEKADIHVTDTGENPEAPQPREMIDLEVGKRVVYFCSH